MLDWQQTLHYLLEIIIKITEIIKYVFQLNQTSDWWPFYELIDKETCLNLQPHTTVSLVTKGLSKNLSREKIETIKKYWNIVK